MTEVVPTNSEPLETSKARAALDQYTKDKYDEAFLSDYSVKHPDDYAQLSKLLREDQSSDELDAALKKLDSALDADIDGRLKAYVSGFDFGPNGNVSASNEKGVYKISYRNSIAGDASDVNLVKKGGDFIGPWTVENRMPVVQYADLEDASEDMALLGYALGQVKDGQLKSTVESPFVMNGTNLAFTEEDGSLLILKSPNVTFSDWVDAQNPEAFVDLLNARYSTLIGAPARPGMGDVRVADKELYEKEAAVKTEQATEQAEEKKLVDAAVVQLSTLADADGSLRKNLDDTNAAYLKASREGGSPDLAAVQTAAQAIDAAYATEHPEVKADSTAATESVGTGARTGNTENIAKTPEVADTIPPHPDSPEAFSLMLHEKGKSEKYATMSSVEGGTHMELHLPQAWEVKHSRIDHFVGAEGEAVLGLAKPEENFLKLSKDEHGQKAGTEYTLQDGTWKDKDGKRLLVYNGTTFDVLALPKKTVATTEPTTTTGNTAETAPVAGVVPAEQAAAAATVEAPAAVAVAAKPAENLYDPDAALDADEKAILVQKTTSAYQDTIRLEAEQTKLSALVANTALPETERSANQARLAKAETQLADAYKKLEGDLKSMDTGIPPEEVALLKTSDALKAAPAAVLAFAEAQKKSVDQNSTQMAGDTAHEDGVS